MSPDEIRDRFARASELHFGPALCERYGLAPITDRSTWRRELERLRRDAYGEPVAIDWTRVFAAEERAAHEALDRALGLQALAHRFAILDGERVVGVFFGTQDTEARYHMVATLIESSHRGRGIYTALLARVLAMAADVGFREVYSRHHPDNNAVLVPKLKAGFVISGFEITGNHGLLIHLRHVFNAHSRALHSYRVDGLGFDRSLHASGLLRSGSSGCKRCSPTDLAPVSDAPCGAKSPG